MKPVFHAGGLVPDDLSGIVLPDPCVSVLPAAVVERLKAKGLWREPDPDAPSVVVTQEYRHRVFDAFERDARGRLRLRSEAP